MKHGKLMKTLRDNLSNGNKLHFTLDEIWFNCMFCCIEPNYLQVKLLQRPQDGLAFRGTFQTSQIISVH